MGVLEEKRGENESSSCGGESDGDGSTESAKKLKNKVDSDVLDKLMGGKQSAADKPSIEEMDE